MSKVSSRPEHEVRYELGILEMSPSNGWREYTPAPDARAFCTCGQLDTGPTAPDTAWRVAQEHVKRELPGIDWGLDEETA